MHPSLPSGLFLPPSSFSPHLSGVSCVFASQKKAKKLTSNHHRFTVLCPSCSPDSHKIGGQTFGSSSALRQVLEAIHVNAVAKARAGMGECPVFSTAGECLVLVSPVFDCDVVVWA